MATGCVESSGESRCLLRDLHSARHSLKEASLKHPPVTLKERVTRVEEEVICRGCALPVGSCRLPASGAQRQASCHPCSLHKSVRVCTPSTRTFTLLKNHQLKCQRLDRLLCACGEHADPGNTAVLRRRLWHLPSDPAGARADGAPVGTALPISFSFFFFGVVVVVVW